MPIRKIYSNTSMKRKASTSDRKLLRSAISTAIDKYNETAAGTEQVLKAKPSNFAEVARLSFPSDDEHTCINILYNIIKHIDNESVREQLTNQDLPAKVFGRIQGTSSTYVSFKINYNNKEYYVVNKTRASHSISQKQLVPNIVFSDLNPDNEVFHNKEKYIHAVNAFIDNSTMSENVKIVLSSLINCFGDDSDNRVSVHCTGSLACDNGLIGFAKSSSSGECVLEMKNTNPDFDKFNQAIKSLSPQDINNIQNDFGEVLGPALFFYLYIRKQSFLTRDTNQELILSLNKTAHSISCEFPIASNNQLIDYVIKSDETGVINVSAKAWGGGATPSGISIFQSYAGTNRAGAYTPGELDLIEHVSESYNYSVTAQQLALINKFEIEDMSDKWKALPQDMQEVLKEVFAFSKDTDKKLTTTKLAGRIKDIFIKSKISPIDAIRSLYKSYNYINNRSNGINPLISGSKAAEAFNNMEDNIWTPTLNNRILCGIFIYPVWKHTVGLLNEKYGKYGSEGDDVISSFINKQIDMKQVYFGIDNSLLKFRFVSSGTSSWRFSMGGLTTANITNCRLGIKIV